MGITVLGRTKEEIRHLLKFSAGNIRDIKSFLVIYIIPGDKDEQEAKEEVEPIVKEISGKIPYEIKPFTGSEDTAIETFIAKREDLRMVFLHVKKRDIREILSEDMYANIIKKPEKGVIKTPVVFVPHHES